MQFVSEAVFGVINKTGSALKDTYLFKNIKKSLYFAVSMYCLTFIGALFNFSTVLILSWIGLFTIPKLYSNNQVFVLYLINRLHNHWLTHFQAFFPVIPCEVSFQSFIPPSAMLSHALLSPRYRGN